LQKVLIVTIYIYINESMKHELCVVWCFKLRLKFKDMAILESRKFGSMSTN